jgi:signal transduction histidine kinase/CheY-like chemotaxis protein
MSLLKTIILYKSLLKRRLTLEFNNKSETIKVWQANFFADILFFLAPLSVILYIPSLIMSIVDGLIMLAIINTIVISILQYIIFKKKLKFKYRQQVFLTIMYLLGLSLLYFMGWTGPGLVYLLGVSAFSTLVLGYKAGYITLSLNILTFIILAFLSSYFPIGNNLLANLNAAAIITIGLNFILLNLLLVVTISSLIKGLSEKIESEKEVQKKLEFEMQEHKIAKERAQESDRLKTAFLANMSHEIRTPMNGILGFAQLLKEPKLTGDKQYEFITIIEESGERMLNIINNIIDISKIESGQMELFISKTILNDQIDYLYSFFKPEADRKGMTLVPYKNANEKASVIETDSEKLVAILTNLIKNAIKYSEGTTIVYGYSIRNGFVDLFVKDDGIGIPEYLQKAIFERFVKADSSDFKVIEGAGLGLTISKAYVEQLGGEIWIESQPEKGSTFFFRIPVSQKQETKESYSESKTPEKETEAKQLKVLIAEDEKTSDLLMTYNLEGYCKEIIHARNGKEAVEILKSQPDIDLVMMDIRMPEMNGYEATKRIRKFNKDVIIIAQTAYGYSDDREKALASGCNDYISKPIKKEKLIELVKTYSNSIRASKKH